MLKYFFIFVIFLVIAVVTVFGTRGMRNARTPIEVFPDMDHQPKVKAQVPSEFFADGQGARLPVDGTVPREAPAVGSYHGTGKIGDRWGTGIPITIEMADLQRGKERYNINCAICHGPAGYGDGVVKDFGLSTIVTLQDERIRAMADGEIFNTITHGKNNMGAYGANVSIDDRWRIIAYLRALQMSQGVELAKLPEDLQAQFASIPKPEPPAEEPAPAETETAPAGNGEAPATEAPADGETAPAAETETPATASL